jgi:CDP-paratose 2-epimerase
MTPASINRMNILVTGGCGFVGNAICRGLLAHMAGCRVTALDNLRRIGAETNREPLAALGVAIIHGDVRVQSDIDALGPFDWVIDAAAEPSVLAGTSAGAAVGSATTPRQLVEHNLLGTVNLLEAAARWQAGVVILSTSRIYSIPSLAVLPLVEMQCDRGPAFVLDPAQPLPPAVGPAGITEAFSTAAPVSLYGATKLASEALALEYAHRHGTPCVIDRCGVMAGAGQFGRADQGIFSWWIRQWRAGRPLAYIGFGGRGLQVRDCLHPDDLVALLAAQLASPPPAPEIFNVSGGAASATSLAQLSQWCFENLGPGPYSTAQPIAAAAETRPYDLPWVVLDHAAVTARYGWHPRRSPADIFTEIAAAQSANP